SCSCSVNIAHLPAMSAHHSESFATFLPSQESISATFFFRSGCTGLNQAVDLGHAVTDLLEDLARIRAVVGWRTWLLFFAVGDEDWTAHGFDHAMAGIFETCDRTAIAHLRIANRFVERRQRRPLDIVSAKFLAPMTQRFRFELRQQDRMQLGGVLLARLMGR